MILNVKQSIPGGLVVIETSYGVYYGGMSCSSFKIERKSDDKVVAVDFADTGNVADKMRLLSDEEFRKAFESCLAGKGNKID